MERDYGKEIDEIKKDIAEIKAMLTNEDERSGKTAAGDEVGHVKRMNNMHPNDNIMKLMPTARRFAERRTSAGA